MLQNTRLSSNINDYNLEGKHSSKIPYESHTLPPRSALWSGLFMASSPHALRFEFSVDAGCPGHSRCPMREIYRFRFKNIDRCTAFGIYVAITEPALPIELPATDAE
jgi:hypothetical protein